MENELSNYLMNKTGYIVTLALSITFILVAAATNRHENFVLAIPTLILVVIAFVRKERVFIPPLFIAFLAITMTFLQFAKMYGNDNFIMGIIAEIVLGIFTGLLGLMIILSLLRSTPGFDLERPFFVSFSACCIGIALSLILFLTTFFIEYARDPDMVDTQIKLVENVTFGILGSILITALFYLNRHNGLFTHTLGKFLDKNARTLGFEDAERNRILKEIESGESSKLEFKSTLRTNLKTGEKDLRMERAVLKTIVAFLNSRGGTLLIGVADDGTITGVDLDSFEGSKDKFGLHLNNLITKQIGSEFLPFINYGLVDFGDKSVMRVSCIVSDRPVFLDDGKEQVFFVRSGPSSIDLHGMELLYYANHNFGKSLKKHNI